MQGGNEEPSAELIHGAYPCKMFVRYKEDEEQAIAGIREEDIREDGVGMLTAFKEDTHAPETGSFRFSESEINDRSVVVVMDVTVPGAFADGARFQFRPQMESII